VKIRAISGSINRTKTDKTTCYNASPRQQKPSNGKAKK
jgi:hypothetical protein